MTPESEEFAYVQSIIIRFTRNDRTDWNAVAEALGMDLDEVRFQYDLEIPEVPQGEIVTIPGLFPIRNHPEGAPLKSRIVELLANMSAAAGTLACQTGAPHNSIRARLDELFDRGLVSHDNRIPRTWALTEQGKGIAGMLKGREAA